MGLRILFVDDEFAPDTDEELGSYMSYYALALKEAGHEVVRCSDVDRAIDKCQGERFDLVILDVMMPPGEVFKHEATANGGYTGWFLAKELNRLQHGVPVLLLSNYPESRDLFKNLISGEVVRNVVSKPENSPFDFARLVSNYLTGGE